MKILLYEPGKSGHRPVILRYTTKVLDKAGILWELAEPDTEGQIFGVVKQARASGCDVIYVLTLDGIAGFVWRLSWLAKLHGIKVNCIYYLYNNLVEGWKSVVWRMAMFTGFIHRVYISDDRLRTGVMTYPQRVCYLTDPWDPEEFPVWTQAAARERLGIPAGSGVFLMFGMLDERKGADLFLEASRRAFAHPALPNIEILLVGRMSAKVKILFDQCAASAHASPEFIAVNGEIPEVDVSLYFYAADYVVCAYPAYFKVSSGTITRAWAAGRPVIAPSHGVNATTIKENGCGLLFDTGSVESLAKALKAAASIRSDLKYKRMSQKAEAIATCRTLESYGEQLLKETAI